MRNTDGHVPFALYTASAHCLQGKKLFAEFSQAHRRQCVQPEVAQEFFESREAAEGTELVEAFGMSFFLGDERSPQP